jgi:ABC-type antimicrobial peptide transport system permease subunit
MYRRFRGQYYNYVIWVRKVVKQQKVVSNFASNKYGSSGISGRRDVKGHVFGGNITGYSIVTVWFLDEQHVNLVIVCVKREMRHSCLAMMSVYLSACQGVYDE